MAQLWDALSGIAPQYLAGQYGLMALLTCLAARFWIIPKRIGSVEMVQVVSWTRLCAAVASCSLVMFLAYRLVLMVGPTRSWAGYGWTLGAGVLCYPFCGMLSSIVGLLFDGGRALVVLSGAYRPEQPSRFVDMTKERGRRAQIIPRGSIVAYQLMLFLALFLAGSLLRSSVPK